MNSARRTTRDERRQAKARLAVVAVALSLLTWSLAMHPGEARAQETVPNPPSSTPSSPPEAGVQETGAQEAETSTAASAPASPPPAPPSPLPEENLMVNATGLVLQPLYLVLRVPVALIGGLAGGMVWAVSGGQNLEGAKGIWETTVFQNWGWPEFVREPGAPSAPAP